MGFSAGALLLVLLGAGHGNAQRPEVVKARVELVLVPVTALDKHGQAVRGLRASDFYLLVDAKPLEIASFDEISVARGPTAPTTTEPSTPPLEKSYRNIPAAYSPTGSPVIFLVDYLNTPEVLRLELRKGLLDFFAHRLQPGQEIGVYALTMSLVVVQPLTHDPSSLIAAARRLQKVDGLPPNPREAPTPLSAAVVNTGDSSDAKMEVLSLENARQAYNIDQRVRATRTLEAFRQLAGAFSGLPGKKTVLWLTADPSPLNPTLMYTLPLEIHGRTVYQDSSRASAWDIAKTFEALNSSEMSLSPVDVRGQANTGMSDWMNHHARSETLQDLAGSQPADSNLYTNMTDFRQGESANSTLAMLSAAAETGGIVYRGSNDLAGQLARAQETESYYYLLGFDPRGVSGGNGWKYHRIEVKVKRHGVHLLARRGFVSRPETLIASEGEAQNDIREAANSPVDLTGLPLELKLGELTKAGTGSDFPFTLTIGGGAFLAVQDTKEFRYDFTLVRLLRNQHGEIVDSTREELASAATPAQAESLRMQGLSCHSAFHGLSGKPVSARVIVRDNRTGRMGTITLELPPP
jgi:VWFA-related protein